MRATVRIVILAAVAGVLIAGAAVAQPLPTDVVTVATVSGNSGTTIDVPVYIRDTAGTPLGVDQPSPNRIQSFSFQVLYAPAASVTAVTFTRGGITQPLTPQFESSPAVPGVSIGLLENFDETTNFVPYTSNAPLPGNQVATLHVTLAPNLAPGTTITLVLDPALTQLTDEGGTPATAETVQNGRLTLVNGAIVVASPIPALSVWAMVLMAVLLAVVVLRMRMS